MANKQDQAKHDASVLPRIQALENEGKTLRQIADQLEAEGHPSPARGRKWSHNAVKRILERAKQPQPAPSTVQISDPVTVRGPLIVTGPVTITGPVTMTDPVTMTTQGWPTAASAKDSSPIELVRPATPLDLMRCERRPTTV